MSRHLAAFFLWTSLVGMVNITGTAAATRTWTGSTDANWFNAANWLSDPADGEYPQAGDAVLINSGSVLLTNTTAHLASIAISNATVTFSNWPSALNATQVHVQTGAKLTLPNAISHTATVSNRVYVICTDFTLDSGAEIDAAGRGYAYYAGPGRGASDTAQGAGHGGQGLPLVGTPLNGQIYGDPKFPQTPGSGGSGTPSGHHGGGVIRIDAAGTVRIDGTVNANGTIGGSGGSVFVSCLTYEGGPASQISVNGAGNTTRQGAGGRIAIHYDPAQQALLPDPIPQTVFSARPGNNIKRADAMGSLYLSDGSWVIEPFSQFDAVWLHGDWAASRTIAGNFSPATSIGFGQTNFVLTVTGNLTLDNVSFGVSAGSELHCQNLTLTNSSSLVVISAPLTVPSEAQTTTAYGALVSVTNHMTVHADCWVYPICLLKPFTGLQNNSGVPVVFRAGNLTVTAANAGFNADRFGHPTANNLNHNT